MNYNEKQLKAINSHEPKIVVIAPAGSGKTHSLVGAIQKYHSENPLDKIVAITFTRKAALELQSRSFGTNANCSTIHSWSLKELNKLGVKYKFKVSILQDDQIQEILQRLSRQCGYYSLNQYLLFSYVMGNYNVDVPNSVKMKFEKVLRVYISFKRENKLYDFTDLPLYLFDMLNLYNDEITNVDALFVDEFQDVDDVQAQIFTKVKAKKYFYIGDPRQSIYLFRGAGPQNLENLTDFTHYELNINYRSYQSIIDYATAVREFGPGKQLIDINFKIDSDIRCSRIDEPGEVYVVEDEYIVYDVTNEVEKNTYTILSAFLMKKPYILCRTNKQVKAIEALGYKNVSTIHQAKGLEYNYVIVTDMVLDTEEEVNIAYVACTRAENGLLISDHEILLSMMDNIVVEYRDDLIGGKLF